MIRDEKKIVSVKDASIEPTMKIFTSSGMPITAFTVSTFGLLQPISTVDQRKTGWNGLDSK